MTLNPDFNNPQKHKNKNADYQKSAKAPPLLNERGENKIGFRLRQKSKLNLRPLPVALSKKSGRPDSDLGLNHVVISVQWAGAWI